MAENGPFEAALPLRAAGNAAKLLIFTVFMRGHEGHAKLEHVSVLAADYPK